MFPYILSSVYSLIPFQRGIFKKMTESEFKECLSKNIIPYGLYRVEIIKSNNYQIDRWFRFDDENYYTSIDIKHALELGLLKITRGSERSTAKLTENKVVAMREMYKTGLYPMWMLSQMFSVAKTTVQNIVNRTKWAHVA